MPKVAKAKKTQQWIHSALEDAKTQDIAVLDVRKISDFTDYMLIATGTSNRHVQSSADKVVEILRGHGVRPVGIEGKQLGDWVLIDVGDVVVHIMREQTRDFYNLEKLWSDAKRVEPDQEKKTVNTPGVPRKSKTAKK
jgi:ribosome-associated protein